MKKHERREKILVVQEEKLDAVYGGSGYINPNGKDGTQDPPPDGGG